MPMYVLVPRLPNSLFVAVLYTRLGLRLVNKAHAWNPHVTGLSWFQAVDCIKTVYSINVELRSGGNAENTVLVFIKYSRTATVHLRCNLFSRK